MKIYCDGSARPTNPGPGGFGIVICDNNDNILYTISYKSKWTTNNEMELAAILIAVSLYGNKEPVSTIYSDSAYAINCLTKWGESWRRNNWVKGDGKPPENLKIIQEYFNLKDIGYKVNFEKVAGHKGIPGNELADKLASGIVQGDIVI